MKNTSKFQNVVIATIVGWLVLFVFLPNLMIIATSFLTRDDTNFVKLVFTLDNYARLLDPLYYDVLLHSLNMALLATLACLALGYPFAWFLARLPEKARIPRVLLKLLKQARPPRKARASTLPMRTSPNRSRTPRARSSALPPRRSAPNRKPPSHPPARTLKSW